MDEIKDGWMVADSRPVYFEIEDDARRFADAYGGRLAKAKRVVFPRDNRAKRAFDAMMGMTDEDFAGGVVR